MTLSYVNLHFRIVVVGWVLVSFDLATPGLKRKTVHSATVAPGHPDY